MTAATNQVKGGDSMTASRVVLLDLRPVCGPDVTGIADQVVAGRVLAIVGGAELYGRVLRGLLLTLSLLS